MTPGVVDTDINADWISDPDARANAEELSVFNRIGRPGDVADLVVFLASAKSCWTTGQTVDVSGRLRAVRRPGLRLSALEAIASPT